MPSRTIPAEYRGHPLDPRLILFLEALSAAHPTVEWELDRPGHPQGKCWADLNLPGEKVEVSVGVDGGFPLYNGWWVEGDPSVGYETVAGAVARALELLGPRAR